MTTMRSLEHPLPGGMRDLLPEEARARRSLARAVLADLDLRGYDVVLPPAFEFAEVLERGLGALDPSEVIRFVEPESGEVAALRPDMTPQIARMIATRMHERPAPFRIAYEGTVLRRRSGRARKRRQIPQVGVELVGVAAPSGDLELLEAVASALRAAGLREFVIDLGDAGVVRGLLQGLPPDAAAAVADAVGNKDEHEIEARMREAGADPGRLVALVRQQLRTMTSRAVLEEGCKLLAGTAAEAPAARLGALYEAASARGLGAHLVADLAEIRSAAYYTGMLFRVYARGHGEAIASGGRYDELLGRFGLGQPAVGFGVDLDALAAALQAAGSARAQGDRVLVVGAGEAVEALRGRGVRAVGFEGEGALAYARAWGFSHVLFGREVTEVHSGARSELGDAGLGRFVPST